MALWDKLFTSFKGAAKKEVAVGSKAAIKADAAKAIQKTAAASKPAAVNTATKIYTESAGSNVLKNTAREVAGSKIVKTTAKVATGSIIIGGAAYGLGALSGKGMESVGYGWRDLTNAHTPQETTKQDLDNRAQSQALDQKQFDFLKGFYDWAQKNGYSDSPSTREFYDQYISGNGSGSDAKAGDQGSGVSPWLIGAGALAAAAGIYLLTKKKKGSKK